MVLDFGGVPQLFAHSREFDQGVGEIRAGQATVVVALDGSGDTDDIQEGIDMLPSTGGVVFIKEGTYNITTTIRIDIANVALIGTGKGTKISGTFNVEFLLINVGGAYISQIFFEGNSTGATQRGILSSSAISVMVENCWIESMGKDGILFGGTGMEKWVVENCFLKDNAEDGLEIINADNCIISGNICTGNGGYGINISNAACNKNILIGNICLTNTTGQINDAGTNTHPNGASGTNNLALDDLNIIA